MGLFKKEPTPEPEPEPDVPTISPAMAESKRKHAEYLAEQARLDAIGPWHGPTLPTWYVDNFESVGAVLIERSWDTGRPVVLAVPMVVIDGFTQSAEGYAIKIIIHTVHGASIPMESRFSKTTYNDDGVRNDRGKHLASRTIDGLQTTWAMWRNQFPFTL